MAKKRKTARKAKPAAKKKSARKARLVAKKKVVPKAKTRKRYTDQVKKKIIGFVEAHNVSKGRGGLTAAAKKFKVSQLSIANWIKQHSPVSVKSASQKSKSSATSKLKRMITIQADLKKLNAEYAALKKRL